MNKDLPIKSVVNLYLAQRSFNHRYASFDFCYHYFHPKTGNNLTGNMELSCLQIGFYLASWGMYRGSSGLLQNSVRHYVPLIEYISQSDSKLWQIDIDNYHEENIETLLRTYNDLRKILPPMKSSSHLTLVTKVMLGVFGCTPAFDSYFTQTMRILNLNNCRFRSFNEHSLVALSQFYDNNERVISELASGTKVVSFSGRHTGLDYPKSKILDMYGFMASNV